jgi:hypothetical protein
MPAYFEIVGEIRGREVIAVGSAIRDVERLVEAYGQSRWRKLKGIAMVRLRDGFTGLAEVHWYEAHGVGRFDMKIKALLG